MNESTLKFIKCPKCNGIVDLEIYENKKEIIEGRSISLCFPKYRIYSSGIAGGNLPIALGMAISLKRKNANIEQIIDLIKKENAEIIDISTKEGDLEDVFIQLTKN